MKNRNKKNIIDKLLEKIQETPDKSKKLVIFTATILVFLIIANSIINNNNENYNSIKLDKTKFLVYTKYENNVNGKKQEVPYININSEIAKTINEDIKIFTDKFVDSSKNILTYEYSLNGIILSVAIKIVDYENEIPTPYFRTYNLNLETQEALSDEALRKYYSVTEEEVETKIKNQFIAYYNDESEKGYIVPQECNFKCYMECRRVDDYLKDISYYIRDGKLYVFRPFSFYSIYVEEEYFTDQHFEFLISKEPKY